MIASQRINQKDGTTTGHRVQKKLEEICQRKKFPKLLLNNVDFNEEQSAYEI